MKWNVYSIYDAKTKLWSKPSYAQTHGQVLRDFQDLANDKKTTIGNHPEDYALYCIGSFDDEKGIIEQETKSQSLGMAIEYVKSEMAVPGMPGTVPTVGRKKKEAMSKNE